ncbi:MAG: class I SAM-dependent methyltransferase [Pseudomonadota bacterium]
MAYSKKLLAQLGKPQGLLGRLILRRLNRVNEGMNSRTLELLALQNNDHILEIGFGGGALIAEILAKGRCARVAGVDISPLAVTQAQKRFRTDIAKGSVEFLQGGQSDLPYPESSFTKICCVNVIYFWTDLSSMLFEVFRVLKPEGILILSYAEGAPNKLARFPAAEVEAKLAEIGFDNMCTVDGHDIENGTYHCTSAKKPN